MALAQRPYAPLDSVSAGLPARRLGRAPGLRQGPGLPQAPARRGSGEAEIISSPTDGLDPSCAKDPDCLKRLHDVAVAQDTNEARGAACEHSVLNSYK